MKYQPLFQLVEESGDWSLTERLRGLCLQTAVCHIQSIFLLACKRGDDEQGLRYFELLMQAVDDVTLMRFVVKGEWHNPLFELKVPYKKVGRLKDAMDEARQKRVFLARKLYLGLPFSEDEATLLLTREAMLGEITTRWYETPDEDEAEALFDFLLGLKIHWKEEKKKLLDAIRKATNEFFPVGRLSRCIRKVVPRGFGSHQRMHNDIAGLLVSAWARAHDGISRVASDLRVTQPLVDATPGAFLFVERFSHEVAVLDASVRELLSALKPDKPGLGDRHHNVLGKPHLSYLDTSHVCLLIEHRDATANRWGEEEWDDQFELAVRRIREWQEEHPITVALRLDGYYQYCSGEPSYTREERIGGNNKKH